MKLFDFKCSSKLFHCSTSLKSNFFCPAFFNTRGRKLFSNLCECIFSNLVNSSYHFIISQMALTSKLILLRPHKTSAYCYTHLRLVYMCLFTLVKQNAMMLYCHLAEETFSKLTELDATVQRT